jgi:hypothetical protein
MPGTGLRIPSKQHNLDDREPICMESLEILGPMSEISECWPVCVGYREPQISEDRRRRADLRVNRNQRRISAIFPGKGIRMYTKLKESSAPGIKKSI